MKEPGHGMRVHMIARIIGVLFVASLVSACTSTGRTLSMMNDPQPIEAGKTVSLTIQRGAVAPDESFDKASSGLFTALLAKLTADDVFEWVVEPPDAADYDMQVTVDELRDISPGLRAGFGFLAPRSYLVVTVDLRRRTPDQLVQSFQVTGFGARTWLTPEGYGFDDPIREAVDQIVRILQNDPGAKP